MVLDLDRPKTIKRFYQIKTARALSARHGEHARFPKPLGLVVRIGVVTPQGTTWSREVEERQFWGALPWMFINQIRNDWKSPWSLITWDKSYVGMIKFREDFGEESAVNWRLLDWAWAEVANHVNCRASAAGACEVYCHQSTKRGSFLTCPRASVTLTTRKLFFIWGFDRTIFTSLRPSY